MDRRSAPHRAVNWGQFMVTGTRARLHSLVLAGISCHAASLSHVTDIFLIQWQRTFENPAPVTWPQKQQ